MVNNADVDCTDVGKLIDNKAGKRSGFTLLALLTKWQLDCLKQIQNKARDKFPKEQEKILLNKIKDQVKKLKPELILLDPKDLKFIGVSLLDYKVGGDINFNKFLVESLLSSYQSISEGVPKAKLQNENLLDRWKQTIQYLKQDPQIKFDLDYSTKVKIDKYLEVRKNVNSLYKVHSIIKSLGEIINNNNNDKSIKEKRLVLQRVFHITGEYLKDTGTTPNLLPGVRKSLEEKGIPTKLLSEFRDVLAHYYVFPIEVDNEEIRQLFDEGFLPIQRTVEDKIIETEKSFIQGVIGENESKIKDKFVVKQLKQSKNKGGVCGLEKYIRTIKLQSEYRSMDDESKKLVDEIYQNALQMKSMDFSADQKKNSQPDFNEIKSQISNSITKYIEQSKVKVYEKLYNKLDLDNLDNAHDDVLKITEVIERLRYKDTASPNNNILDNFLSMKILEKIQSKVDNIQRISLKKELEKYFDVGSFKNNDVPYVDFKDSKSENLIGLLNNSISRPDNNKDKLIGFFKSIGKSQGNDIKPDDYEDLVKGLSIDGNIKEKLLLYSVEWRKKKCIDLLEKKPPALKKIYDSIIEGKSIEDWVYKNLAYEYRLQNEPQNAVEQRANSLIKDTPGKIKELYLSRIKDEVDVLRDVKNPYAVESQIINIYSLLEKAKADKEEKFEVKKLRNYLSHGDALTSGEDDKILAKQLVDLKDKVLDKLSDPDITFQKIEGAIDSLGEHLGIKEVRELLCPIGYAPKTTGSSRGSARRARSIIESCLTWGEIDKFSKGKVDENNVDKITVDSEKFLTYVKNSQDEGKNAQSIEFIRNKNIEGDYKYLVDKVIGDQGYERYVQNERIKDLQGDVLQQNSGLTKNPKLKSRLMNAAGEIQLIRGIHGAIVSCQDGVTTDCGLNLGGLVWSFASQPIENVIVKITPGVLASSEKVVGKIPGTLGKQAKFVVRVARVKFGSTVAKGAAGAVGGVFDIVDIGMSANNLVGCKKRENSDNPCGEKEIRDNIASISFSGVSFVSGVALTAAGMPVVGIAAGFALMVGQGIYSGISNIVEYEEKYDTTYGEDWSIFWRTILFQDMASDIQHLAERKNTVNSLAKEVWKALNNATNSVVAYGVGLGKVSDNTLQPDYAKIFMDKEDTNTKDLSRVIPDRIPGASRICLPKVTGQDYEKGITSSVQPPLYYCENAMVISHDSKVGMRQSGKTIVYDLQNVDSGVIVGSNKWNNNFLIYPGTTKITGGKNVANRFVLVNNTSFSGKIIGGNNSTNILDLSQLKDTVIGVNIDYRFKPSAHGQLKVKINNRLLIDDYVSNNLFNYHYIGRQNKVDKVLCMGDSEHFTKSDNRNVIIDSGAGLNRNGKDVVENCRKVIISPYTTVKGRKSNYTFYVKTADYKGKSLYSEINVDGTGTVVFPEIDLLSDCDQITYSKQSNTLSLKINFGQNNQFTLDIKNYVEQSSNKPHFVLIDKNGSNIVPKIERSDSAAIKINSFELHSKLDKFDDVETHYKKILSNNKDYKVLSVIRGKTQSQDNSVVSHMVFGSSGDDVIHFDQGTMFARGGKGSDVYVIACGINNKEIQIDNYSDDKKADTLFMPEVEKGFLVQQCNLHLNYNNTSIQVKNYLQDRNYRHLVIMNKKGETFIPDIRSMSCSSSGKGKLVPFLRATQTQNMFLLPKDFEGDDVVIDSRLEDIEKYKDKDDLLLIRESGIPFIIRIEEFYIDRSKWGSISYSLWNNNDLLPSSGLLENVDNVMEYKDKLKNNYERIVKEYIEDFGNSTSIIQHNQKLDKNISTSVGQDEERIGVMILKNITPDRVEVSSSGTDLIFRDKKSNHTIKIKDWDHNESYRISRLEFDLGLEPIKILRLNRFSLFEVKEIQSLIDKASENYQSRNKYTSKVETDFKCLVSIAGFANKNSTYQCLGLSSLQDQVNFVEGFCSLEQLSEFRGNLIRGNLNSTQISALSRNLQNNLLLSGYDQDVINQCSELMMNEESNQQSKISSMVKDIEESTFLGQSENKLDLGGCLSERKKRSSDLCPAAFLENIYNELNREESERRNVVVEESSIRVITSDHETLDIEDLPIREVVINDNINRKRSLRSTLDLHNLVQQINKDLGIKPISMVIKDASDLLIKVSISATDLQQDVMTVRLKDALINKWYKKLQIIFNNTPMEIGDSLDLKPSLLISDKRIIVVTPQEVEEKNKLVISKKAGQYAFLYSGYDLIVTNAFNANMELCIIYFKDFYKEPKMKTLSIRFTDKEILLSDEIDKIYNADSIDKLNYVSSITNLQKSLITSLHLAAQNGDLDQVKLLFDNGGNIEAQDEFGKTPILCAAEAGKWSIVEFLLDNGANINSETTYQETPLHWAVQEGNLDIVKFLFDRGADIESQNAYNEKPLHLAIKAGRLKIVKLLLDRGANINAKDKDGKTPLDVAKDQKHDVIIQYLEQAQLNEQLLAAVKDSDFNEVQGLVNRGANVNAKDKDGKTPLHYASRSVHHLGMVKYLISKGADINVKDNSGRTPEDEERYTDSDTMRQVFMQAHLDRELLLTVKNKEDLKTINDLIAKDISDRTHGGFYYAWSGNLGTVGFLVGKDVSVNATDKYGCTLLHWATLKGHLDIAKFLIGKGANVNAEDILGRKPMHFAVINNHKNIIEFFLNEKVTRVDSTDKQSRTLLHWASWSGNLDMVEYLIGKGANINAKCEVDGTPLDIARDKGHNNVVEYLRQAQLGLDRQLLTAVQGGDLNEVRSLIAQGANIDTKDGNTPLYSAAEIGDLNLVKLLLDNGANIEAKNGEYQATPLHGAVENYRLDIVKLLLNRCANVNAEDKGNWTPLHYAADNDNLNIVKLLVDAGANLSAKSDHGITPLDIAKDKGHNNIVEYLEKKLREERGKPLQRKRRHHHGDHNHHRSHLSYNLLTIDSSGQPEIAASSGARTSSWINDLFSWVKNSIGKLSSKPEETSSTASSISQVNTQIDADGTIMLLDLLIRKVTGRKYISSSDQNVPLMEAQGYALNIVERFEQVLNEAAIKSGISAINLDFNPVKTQLAIIRQIRNGKFSEISKTLYSFTKEACPELEQTDKFLAYLKSCLKEVLAEKEAVLLQQKVEQTLDQQISRKVELPKRPDTFLNGTSVVKGINNILGL